MISAMIKRKGGMAMIYTEQEMEHSGAMQTAARMCTAARTAPKTRHIDGIHTLVVTGEEKEELAQKMEEFGKAHFKDDWQHWYGRDAQNVRVADAVVLVGVEKAIVVSSTVIFVILVTVTTVRLLVEIVPIFTSI